MRFVTFFLKTTSFLVCLSFLFTGLVFSQDGMSASCALNAPKFEQANHRPLFKDSPLGQGFRLSGSSNSSAPSSTQAECYLDCGAMPQSCVSSFLCTKCTFRNNRCFTGACFPCPISISSPSPNSR
jgi:hypothetical protein